MATDIAHALTAHGAILFDRAQVPQADAAWLQPAYWTDAHEESARGGRGAVWFVRGGFGAGVLRHYRRGGLVARVNGDRYLWSAEDATRSFREFRLLAELRTRGLPVPVPLLAGYVRSGFLYRADLLTALIPQARTLAQRLGEEFPSTEVWRGIGTTLARFHAHGACHADLNAHNVMLGERDDVWVIDFDRGRLRPPSRDWQQGNLARLQRSLRKLGAERNTGWSAAWAALDEAYRARLDAAAHP